MYEITIDAHFSAAHAIDIRGQREPLHGHDWHVTATVASPRLDPDGLLLDFHLLERELNAIIAPFHNRNLNEVEPFNRLNPTAEHVAQHIADQLVQRLHPHTDPDRRVRVESVRVTEAPGCAALYRPRTEPGAPLGR